VFAEYVAHTTAKATGRTLHHMLRAVSWRERLIKLVREISDGSPRPRPFCRRRQGPTRSGEEIFSLPPDYRAEAATLKYESMANRDRGADELT